MTREERKEYNKAYNQTHKRNRKEYMKAYNQAHKEEQKAYRQSHMEEYKARYKAWRESHKEKRSAYSKMDVNSSGKPKDYIRRKSQKYLDKHGTKKAGYEIHHCCTYDEPYKFIYCSHETHLLIHSYLRENNIDADSKHYEQIKHLIDDTVVLYGIEREKTNE